MRKCKESYEIKLFALFCFIMIIHDAIEMAIVDSLLFLMQIFHPVIKPSTLARLAAW